MISDSCRPQELEKHLSSELGPFRKRKTLWFRSGRAQQPGSPTNAWEGLGSDLDVENDTLCFSLNSCENGLAHDRFTRTERCEAHH